MSIYLPLMLIGITLVACGTPDAAGNANAKPSSSDTDVQLICGTAKRGQGVVISPTVRNVAPGNPGLVQPGTA